MTRWFPGVLQAIVEEVKSRSNVSTKNLMMDGSKVAGVKELLAHEATKTLEDKRNMQIAATKEKTLDEIKAEMGIPLDESPEVVPPSGAAVEAQAPIGTTKGEAPPPTKTRRRVRQKMRSTPVTGGSLFDTPQPPAPQEQPKRQTEGGNTSWAKPFSGGVSGESAELVVGGEVFKIRVMPETIHRIRSGYSGELLDDASVKFSQADVPIEHRLQGFIRTGGLSTIAEDVQDTASSAGFDDESDKDSQHESPW